MTDAIILALIVGAATYALRLFPTWINLGDLPPGNVFARFLAATGPAAIATLFVASVLPMLQTAVPLPLIGGIIVVVGVFLWRRSVVVATLAGAVAYGAVFWMGCGQLTAPCALKTETVFDRLQTGEGQ